MWSFASNCIAGKVGPKTDTLKGAEDADCSDDEVSSTTSREEGLECPICWESFNIVENVPYVLWCGHTLCKNCILGLQWAVVKFPTLPLQLPHFIACPWCNLLSLRLVYRGNLKFPRKNFFLLWMLESMNGDRTRLRSAFCGNHQPSWLSGSGTALVGNSGSGISLRRRSSTRQSESSEPHHDRSRTEEEGFLAIEWLHSSLRKLLIFFFHLTAKFPLVVLFLLIILSAIPASAAILALYMVITIVFALPSFLILYFAYPSLDWLVREIIT
ncbi:PREDICTED: uncharacterized protein LOC109153607 [Ipomoea nil]|uniref:uncharacterized protein LOC109153607 n=1 Tax=Ipomoea nil TaxID=35883 RepID=UPI000900D0BB|nr:PREDICTED: uncharacterized protein LOC109153607 [Ipomoea nil]XP_019157002.1 PREDICTED: uncharacterized protein LOC109153607 [Ipomoea nil]XP_019157003.1 PREDICTED: uncharacterized protein LOC109153607 [Ipomoea nil]